MSLKHRTVLVTSAGGAQGQAIVRRLQAAGATPRALLRPNSPNPFGSAVEVARGDMGEILSMRRAALGADLLALTLPQIPDRQTIVRFGRNAIDAAAGADVRLVVFNASGPTTSGTGVAQIEAKAELMGYLNAARVPFIVLRPTLYMENILQPWSVPAILQQGVFAYPTSAGFAASWISRDDAAAAVVAALDRPELAGSWLDLGGPDLLTGPQIATILSQATGRNVGYAPIPIPEFARSLNAVLGAGVGDQIAALYDWYDRQPVSPLAVDPRPAAKALGVSPVSFRTWAEGIDWHALAARAA